MAQSMIGLLLILQVDCQLTLTAIPVMMAIIAKGVEFKI